jgi:hypothetical protein
MPYYGSRSTFQCIQATFELDIWLGQPDWRAAKIDNSTLKIALECNHPLVAEDRCLLRKFIHWSREGFGILIALGLLSPAAGCGVDPNPDWIGNVGVYNYSPSVIQSGSTRQVWWCGEASNPDDSSQDTDAILYESINLKTDAIDGPRTVMAETPHAWDSAFTCNPQVIGGTFSPFGDGKSYTYAMYYVGTAAPSGLGNSIGVAFSNDGISWRKYPQPIIKSSSSNYGVGQPAAYNTDGKSAITLFYEDSDPTLSHIAATSSDGVHFTTEGTLTTAGLDSDDPQASWGDIAYDTKTNSWYAIFNRTLRAPSTTGGVIERGQLGVELYRIPASSLLTGATPWQDVDTIDTSVTGYESNFLAGFVRDPYDNINVGTYPDIEMYVTESDPQPSWRDSPAAAAITASPHFWELHLEKWVPSNSTLPLSRYFNGKVHEVTTGWVDPSGGFGLQSVLGQLYQSPQNGATLPFYGCKHGGTDYFVSLDSACEGQRILGKDGYAYSQPVAGLNLVALYRCRTSSDHFVSKNPNCEGQITDELLGYVVP